MQTRELFTRKSWNDIEARLSNAPRNSWTYLIGPRNSWTYLIGPRNSWTYLIGPTQYANVTSRFSRESPRLGTQSQAYPGNKLVNTSPYTFSCFVDPRNHHPTRCALDSETAIGNLCVHAIHVPVHHHGGPLETGRVLLGIAGSLIEREWHYFSFCGNNSGAISKEKVVVCCLFADVNTFP